MAGGHDVGVVVYGANGTVGSLVARALGEVGIAPTVAGRDGAGVQRVARALGCPARAVRLDDAEGLRTLARAATVLVNCAGPSAQTGLALLDACLHAATHYLDVSGEARFVARVFASRDAYARARGVAVCPGYGAKGALGDWAANHLRAGCPAAWMRVAYAHQGTAYWRPSLGALLSVAHEGLAWEARRPADHGLPPRAFDFPPPFARGTAVQVSGTEQITLPWTLGPTAVDCYLSVDPGTRSNRVWGALHDPRMAWLTRPAAPRLWRALLAGERRATLRRTLAPRGDGGMAVVVESADGSIAVSTPDAYRATAAIVVEAVRALLQPGKRPTGVLTPTQLIAPALGLGALVQRGFVRVLTDGRLTE